MVIALPGRLATVHRIASLAFLTRSILVNPNSGLPYLTISRLDYYCVVENWFFSFNSAIITIGHENPTSLAPFILN